MITSNRIRIGLLLPVLVLLAATPSSAQDQLFGLYEEGSVSLDYAQWPFGSYSGSFSAEGSVLDSLLWGDEQVESCGGSLQSVSDTTLAWCYGALYNPDTTVDVVAIFVRGTGDLVPGDYAVDPTSFMAGYIFFDGVSELVIPEDAEDIIAWLGAVSAEHKFFSSTGTIRVDAVSATEFRGSFSGTAVDPETFMIISVDDGEFALTGLPTAIVETPAAGVRAAAYPNPFNPATRLVCALDETERVSLTIHDARGRLLETLVDGVLPAGEHAFEWRATDARGRALPGGLYLYRIRTRAGAATGKLVLLP